MAKIKITDLPADRRISKKELRMLYGGKSRSDNEMARELLWREYPTDQRGSYFYSFWQS